jgi:hypothetical protein
MCQHCIAYSVPDDFLLRCGLLYQFCERMGGELEELVNPIYHKNYISSPNYSRSLNPEEELLQQTSHEELHASLLQSVELQQFFLVLKKIAVDVLSTVFDHLLLQMAELNKAQQIEISATIQSAYCSFFWGLDVFFNAPTITYLMQKVGYECQVNFLILSMKLRRLGLDESRIISILGSFQSKLQADSIAYFKNCSLPKSLSNETLPIVAQQLEIYTTD